MSTKKIQIVGSLTDTTLTESGKAADAKTVGDAMSELQTYADNAVAQKSQVQIITWEADD